MGENELSFVDKLDDRAESWTSVEAESWMRVDVVESSRLFWGGFRVDGGEALRYGYKYSIQFGYCYPIGSCMNGERKGF